VTTILTGASGFIGARVAHLLKTRGERVIAIGRSGATGLPFRTINLLTEDPRPLLAVLAPTRLVHLAWNADRSTIWNGTENLAWVAATLRLVLAFREAGGQRAVLAGSSAEYDWSHEHLEEGTTPLAPHTGYGTAKRALHDLLFGPGDKTDRLLSQVIDGVVAGRPVALSAGEQIRPFIHVDDVAAALVALLDSPVEGAVNVALNETVSVRDLALMAAGEVGDTGLLRFGGRSFQPGEPKVMQAAVSRLSDEVGFRPRYTIRTGVTATVADRLISVHDAKESNT
jgi:nucleoside-diphosphate-sugar epimerase